MEFRPVERAPDAFQQSVTAEQVEAMCRRAFGSGVRVVSAVEFGYGTYNNTYQVDLGEDRPVVLRVAPEPARQFRAEREFMRTEYACLPYLAPIAPLLPRTLAVDFTHELIGRDYMVQTMLDGVHAPDGLAAYPRPQWASFFRHLGTIAHRIHVVRGHRFGRVLGPTFATWSEAVLASLADIAADLDDSGLDARDVREALAAAEQHRAVLDEITEPRLLHGDLWTVNVMIDPAAAEPPITGVFDNDRMSWGDPASDWPIAKASQPPSLRRKPAIGGSRGSSPWASMARRRPGTEREAFWESYGQLTRSPSAELRALLYRARDIGASRLERHRLGNVDGRAETYVQLRDVLEQLRD